MSNLFGIETEYGISVEGKGASELVAESRALVNAYKHKFASPWYYRGEDSRKDMRGFHVDKLNYDPEDAKYDDPKAPMLPAEKERADHVLVNGARFYNDHGHPEYSTPECDSLIELVAHDRAGERIVWESAQNRMESGSGEVTIYKNNTDYHGSSYGTHENYLLSRARPFGEVLANFLPFMATRIIYTGAGRVGSESKNTPFQISQRADYFTEEASVDTLHRRPIFNTRDEPHADPRDWRRLHVICGDANLSEFATALKIGTMALVVALTESGWTVPIRLQNPVQAIQSISHDQSFQWIVTLSDGKTISAVDLQRIYLSACKDKFAGQSSDADWTLTEWEKTLNALEGYRQNPCELINRIDWIARRQLIDEYRNDSGLSWDAPELLSLDLEYSNINPELGLHAQLEQCGEILRLVDDAAVELARNCAPQSTRAAIRGRLIEKFGDHVGVAGWNRLILRSATESWIVKLDNYLTPDSVVPVLEIIDKASSFDNLIALLPVQGSLA